MARKKRESNPNKRNRRTTGKTKRNIDRVKTKADRSSVNVLTNAMRSGKKKGINRLDIGDEPPKAKGKGASKGKGKGKGPRKRPTECKKGKFCKANGGYCIAQSKNCRKG